MTQALRLFVVVEAVWTFVAVPALRHVVRWRARDHRCSCGLTHRVQVGVPASVDVAEYEARHGVL